jgi:hypothetical protein
MDTRRHPRVESSHRARRCDEPLSKLDFEPGDLISDVRDSDKDIARQKPERELVRVVKNDGVVHGEVEI